MKAPRGSHTVLLANPESALASDALPGSMPRLGKLFRTEEHPFVEYRHQCHRDHADGPARKRLLHEADNHADENRKVVPRVLCETLGRRNESDRNRRKQRRKGFPVSTHATLPLQKPSLC